MEELENNPRVSREEMFKFIFEDLLHAETLLANYTPATKNLPSLAVICGLRGPAPTSSWADSPNRMRKFRTGDAATVWPPNTPARPSTLRAAIMTESQCSTRRPGSKTVNSSWMGHDPDHRHRAQQPAGRRRPMATEAIWGYSYGAQPGISVFSYNRISSGDFPQKELCRSRPLVRRHRTLYDPDRGGVRNDSPLRIV